jgi:hypothetical protein
VVHGQHPADRGLDTARRCDRLVPPAHEVLAVLVAGQFRAGDHRARLRERQRLVAELRDQVDGTLPLVQVGSERAEQVTERLPAAERADGNEARGPARDRGRVRGRDQYPPVRPARPEPLVEVDACGEVIEDHQPGAGRVA